jgi:Domain of unknown function (DUF4326)
MAQSPWQVGSELEWDHYAEQMHRYRCGERRGKPRVPWQHGTHINSLPIEHNAPSANRQRRRRASTSCWPVWRHRVMADRLRTMPRVLNQKTHGWPPDAVYIGRRFRGRPASKWQNPFVIGKDGTRSEVIAKYEQHLVDSGLIDHVHELRGRDLVCWCAPDPCHGDVLLELANR